MNATVDDALSLLDEMNEQGRIEYSDYSRLHDAIAATLGGGTLTAEQVRKAVNSHGNIMDNRFYCSWQAIADELNAALGGGECECESSLLWDSYHGRDFFEHRLSCGHTITSDWEESPNYCEVCGARIRKAVKR